MNLRMILSSVLLMLFAGVGAQNTEIITTSFAMDKVKVPAKEIIVSGTTGEVSKEFTSFLSNKYKVKSKVKNDMIEAKAIILPGLIERKGDLLVSFNQIGGKTSVKAGYALGYGIFVKEDSYPEEFGKLGELLNQFELRFQVKILEEGIKQQKVALKAKRNEIALERKSLGLCEDQLKALKKDAGSDKAQIELMQQKMETSMSLIRIQEDALKEINQIIKKSESEIKAIKARF